LSCPFHANPFGTANLTLPVTPSAYPLGAFSKAPQNASSRAHIPLKLRLVRGGTDPGHHVRGQEQPIIATRQADGDQLPVVSYRLHCRETATRRITPIGPLTGLRLKSPRRSALPSHIVFTLALVGQAEAGTHDPSRAGALAKAPRENLAGWPRPAKLPWFMGPMGSGGTSRLKVEIRRGPSNYGILKQIKH
jgi:hypothetical protein